MVWPDLSPFAGALTLDREAGRVIQTAEPKVGTRPFANSIGQDGSPVWGPGRFAGHSAALRQATRPSPCHSLSVRSARHDI